jgi:DNA-binding CsgD family transcriptional regulator
MRRSAGAAAPSGAGNPTTACARRFTCLEFMRVPVGVPRRASLFFSRSRPFTKPFREDAAMSDGLGGSAAALEPRLVDLVYAALVDEGAWSRFVGEIRQCLPGGKATLFYHDEGSGTGVFAVTDGFEDDWLRRYNSVYCAKNPWMAKVSARPVGLGARAEKTVPAAALRKTEFYADFLKPQGLETGIGVTLFQEHDRRFFLSVLGREADPDAAQQAADMLTRIAPHLRRVFELYRRRGIEGAAAKAMSAAFGALDVGVAAIGAGRRIRWMNDTAEKLVAAGAGARVDASGRAVLAADDAARAVDEICGGAAAPRQAPRSVSAFVAAVGDAPAVRLTVIDAGMSAIETFFAGPTAIVVMTPVARPRPVSLDELKRRYGLTAREAEMVAEVVAGHSVPAIAERRGISRETVRVHLKSVFGKVGVHRQSELIARVMAMGGGSP